MKFQLAEKADLEEILQLYKNNNLDLLFKQSRSQSQSTERNKDFEQSFGNSLDSVLKIQDNYFRCKFHTEDLFK